MISSLCFVSYHTRWISIFDTLKILSHKKEGCIFTFKWGWQVASLLFFQSSNCGVLDYVSQHLLSQVKQFTSIFKRFLTITLRWQFSYYVRGWCRLISKKSSNCTIWLSKISPNFTLILKSDSGVVWFPNLKSSVKICGH